VLLAAARPIDGPLREALADGAIALVRAEWLVGPAAGPRLVRRQELPAEAFVPAEEAAAMLDRGDRSLLVVSHAWMTPSHPDPLGVTLRALQAYVRAEDARRGCACFVDYCSLMQKDARGERTAEEREAFSRGLGVMASLYASITGTAVLVQRTVPPRPAAAEGGGGAADEAAMAVWNSRPYGERGWCSFEYGVASMAATHLRRIVAQLEQQRRAAPDAVRRAEQSRPKLVELQEELTDERARLQLVDCGDEPVALLRAVTRTIEGAMFTNDADRMAVAHMLFALEWTMHVAIDEVLGRGERRARLTAAPRREWLTRLVGKLSAALRAGILAVPGGHKAPCELAVGFERRTDDVELLDRSHDRSRPAEGEGVELEVRAA
jgi:hypothetical protein